MLSFPTRRNRLALAFAAIFIASTAAFASWNTALDTSPGPEWKCWRLVWVTSCTQTSGFERPPGGQPWAASAPDDGAAFSRDTQTARSGR